MAFSYRSLLRTRLSSPARCEKARKRHKVGLPPGTLVFAGDASNDAPVRVLATDFNREHLEEREGAALPRPLPHRDTETVSWIHVCGVHDVEVLRQIGAQFDLHPLLLEDLATPHQRPKFEAFDDVLFAVVHALTLENNGRIRSEQVSLVVGSSFVLSFQEHPHDVFAPIRERLRNGRGRIRSSPPAYLAYTLLDLTVDRYLVVLDALASEAEALEDEILDAPTDDTQPRLHALRRDLTLMRRLMWPTRDLLNQLLRLESPLWSEEVRPFLRDAYDHIAQVGDRIDAQRDVVNSLMELLLSALNQRMNEIMKVLTVIGTIFLPLTFVVGIYGMNFEWIPELQWRYGYPVTMLSMALLAAGLLLYFRRHDWI